MVECNDMKIQCSDCGSSGSSIYLDLKNGEVVCVNCGTVLPNVVYWKNEIYDK